MSETIDYDGLVAMLRRAVEQVKANHETLSKLDSYGGDGDHGTTMLRVVANIEKTVDDSGSPEIKSLLSDIGWAVMGVDGGATGPLFGMFFMGLSEAVGDSDTLDAGLVASVFESGLASVQKQTKAQVGDKTMIDALVPGVNALREAIDAGSGIPAALRQAAAAAAEGARGTEQLRPRFGRAKNTAEQSVGHADAGATSVSLILKGFSEGTE